ncbi:cupin domain-containing protein [Edaphobacter dinghuensis]|nr:cupin domain-containing protein [Edaphobacter dinghuensis]
MPDSILRKPLLSAVLGTATVTRVEVREIVFQPGQQTGRHLHPCPVVGYIAEGEALFQKEGDTDIQRLPAGSAFYEPANAVVSRFDNASTTQPMKFIAYYLLNGEQELIHILPQA